MPLAPARLSTTTCRFNDSVMSAARRRAITSAPPPGANGTINLMGLTGYGAGSWAAARINPGGRASFPRAGLRLTSLDASTCANGTTMRTGLTGYACACAAPAATQTAIAATACHARQKRAVPTTRFGGDKFTSFPSVNAQMLDAFQAYRNVMICPTGGTGTGLHPLKTEPNIIRIVTFPRDGAGHDFLNRTNVTNGRAIAGSLDVAYCCCNQPKIGGVLS